MSYDKQHTEDDCDKCLERVGKNNLHMLPFLYMDCNDYTHKNQGNGYRQYFVCDKCYDKEMRIYKQQQ